MALKEHVTAQEYDQTLRDTVNAYYEHAINDPNMSQDEALSSTVQMAEEYLAASEEFQAEMAEQEAAGEVAGEVGGGESVSSEGGIDGGDGGIE